MPWAIFAVALLAALLLQTTLLAALGISDDVDLPLVVAILCGLLAPSPDARIAGWIAGACQDLSSGAGLGPHAIALGVTVWLLTLLREWAPVRPLLTRTIAVFFAALPGQLLVLIHLYWWRGQADASLWQLVSSSLEIDLWSTLVAVVITSLPWLARRRRPAFRSARSL